ncbi:aldo/keto reductase [Micromonospora krabiensis]|uniref:Predicted oxidoreductase n=1 Tax=Micromonospora krabiensis TaxID=307121 RepID=A0A1C3MZT6_9ACTN|nr:aldo/keto reductase [Micromonospora krabiensis]SBV25853.1 Predicted oxidoreductase [Micromonospora krabiensis]
MPTDEITAAAAGTWTLGDRTVNRMGFGSMRITADPDPARAVTVLRRALELGVNHIDTAAFYVSPGGTLGGGEGSPRYATELIRTALAPYPEDLLIATKVGPAYDADNGFTEALTPAGLRAQVEENLRRLGRDHLDLVNLRAYRRKPTSVPLADRFGALAELRSAGLIRHLGLSNVVPEQLDEVGDIAPVVCVQNAYGVDSYREEDDVVRLCRARWIAYVPFFALAGTRREAGATGEANEAVRAVADAHGVTPHQVRLAWTLHQGPHVLAIPGTGNPAHLAANVAAAGLRLTPEDLARLD